MGNAQSQQGVSQQGVSQQQIDLVTQYVNSQQEMIKMQQQQINSMLRSGPQQAQQAQQRGPPQRNQPKILPPSKPNKKQIDPYKVLGLDKDQILDEKILKRAYIRKARKYHPDKGGNKQMFQMISIAYTVLKKKIQDSKQDLSHQELRNGSQDFLDNQEKKINPNLTGTDFDVNLFNKIFNDNKIPTPTDSGYSQWMKESQGDDTSKMFNGKFNKTMFDSVFTEEKKRQEEKYGDSQIIKYEGPQSLNSNENGQIVEVGQGEIEDFSGNANNLQYRDYRDAFTRSCLISDTAVDPRQEYKSVQHYQADRGNISFELSPEEGRRQEYLENKKKKQEHRRREITRQRDQTYEQQYNKINSLLLK